VRGWREVRVYLRRLSLLTSGERMDGEVGVYLRRLSLLTSGERVEGR
jgi:hypothetical protein